MHYVIIGNGVAGMNAANVIRNREEDADISIVSYESDHFFSRTALMYVFCGQLSQKCVEPYERDYYDKMNFRRVRDQVMAIETDRKTLHLEQAGELKYDKLLIAAGSVANMIDWPGVELDGVGNFVTWQDLEWMEEKAKTARSACVVGGGLIGIESAEILQLAGIQTHFLIREDYFWPVALSKDEGDLVTDHMREHGVDVRLKTEMREIMGRDGKVVGVKTTDGETIDCDMVVITIGVRPQTDWLKDSGIDMDDRGGIVVDDYLKTNIDDIYAAGDCTSVVWFNGVRRPEQLWYTSRDQGLVAGLNITTDDLQKEYERGTFYNSAKFFEIEYTTAGLVNFGLEGEENWYQHEPGTHFTERITYLPDRTVVGFNLLGRRWDHRVLVSWIERKKKLDWVLDHFHEALFDEEFMPKFKLQNRAS